MKHWTLIVFASLTSLFSSFNHSLTAQEVMARAAIDFGSGAIKIQVGIVDTDCNCTIGRPLLAKVVRLGLTEDLARHDGWISTDMRHQARAILHSFKEEAIEAAERAGYTAMPFTGIATAVFRTAKNGKHLLADLAKDLDIPFRIASQDEEGGLGFLTARVLNPEATESSLLAWDSGGSSLQLTMKDGDTYRVYQGPLGHGTVRVILARDIRENSVSHSHRSGNPVSKEEALQLAERIAALLPPTPDWLRDRIDSPDTVIVSFGDGESIFARVAEAAAHLNGSWQQPEQAIISLEDVQRVIDTYVGQDDDTFLAAGLQTKTVTSALFLFTVMKHLDIRNILYKRSIGNTPGMLIAPGLWN